VHAGSDAVTDTGTSRAARRYAFSATRRRTTDGSDAGRYDRSAGGASRAAHSTANDPDHDASNYATGHPQGSGLGAAASADMAICWDEASASAFCQAVSDVLPTASGMGDRTSETSCNASMPRSVLFLDLTSLT
jgi:hypothetical protein